MEHRRSQIVESPVRSLFSSNEEPTEEQIRWIQDTVCSIEADLDLYSMDTPEARSRHSADALFCNMHRSLLSPTRRVPYEIWELIIRSAVQNNREFGNIDCTFRIGGVCSVWNNIAKSLPELSSILPPIHFARPARMDPVLLDRLLRRIMSTPSATPLFFQFPDPIKVNGQWQFIAIDSLPYYTRRWGSLSIKIKPGPSICRMLPTNFIFSAARLRQLKIYVPSEETGGDTGIGECDVFKASSALENVEVECMAPFSLQIPWDQLTGYKEISHRSNIGMESILRRNRVLEKLEYRTDSSDVVVGIYLINRITFDYLKFLDIRIYDDSISGSCSLLEKLLAPALQTLRVRDYGTSFDAFLVDFITESGCGLTLTTLVLDTCQMEPGNLMEILKYTPMLTILECNDIPLTDLCILSIQTGRKKEATLVPLLRNLTVHSPSFIQHMDALARDRSRLYRDVSIGEAVSSSYFSAKLLFSDRKRYQNATEILFGDHHPVRYSVCDALCELDIQVDEIKAGLKKELNSTWKMFLRQKSNPGTTLDGIFGYLTSFPIETIPEAMPWAIHVLERFSVLDPAAIPYNAKYRFSDICNTLVCSWKYLLKRHSFSQGWILHGRHGFFYVAKADDRLADYNFTEDKDTFWGDYNFSENKPVSEYIAWRRKFNFDYIL